MTLRLALKDGEQVVVNGAVLRSVGRTELLVEGRASILRGRDILSPKEANTPARSLYFHTVMAYIDEAATDAHHDRIIAALQAVAASMPFAEAQAVVARFARQVAGMRYYQALADCRILMNLETAFAADALSEVAA